MCVGGGAPCLCSPFERAGAKLSIIVSLDACRAHDNHGGYGGPAGFFSATATSFSFPDFWLSQEGAGASIRSKRNY